VIPTILRKRFGPARNPRAAIAAPMRHAIVSSFAVTPQPGWIDFTM
jgi:hypothetical protein